MIGEKMDEETLTYADGSWNVYEIKKESIEYIPVKKENSSSGNYSGGEPVSKSITEEAWKKIKTEFDAIYANKKIQIKDRVMGSGMLSIIKKGKQSTVLIGKSPEMESLEMSLKQLIGNYKNATDMTNKRPKTFEQPKQFVPGPAIRPTAPLLRWLNEIVQPSSGPRVRVRLPVIVRWSQDGLSIEEAFIGTVDRVDAKTVFLRLNDSAMGVSLFDRVSERCSKSETACAVWLDGYWDSRIPTDRHREGMEARVAARPEHWSFTVIRFHELIEGTTDEEAVYAQSESPSP